MVTQYAKIIKKIPNPFYKILAQGWIDKEFPRHLFIETTERCNRRCSFCPRPNGVRDMDFGLFKKIVDEASKYGGRSFSLHLFGEPLLYPKIFDSISYIKRRNRNHTVLLTTNGTLLERYATKLLRRGVDRIQWSHNEEARISNRVLGLLKKSGKFTVRVIGGGPKKWNGMNTEQRDFHNYGGTKMDLSRSIRGRYPCYHLWLAPAITADGLMTICCADPQKKAVVGDIKTESIAEVWKRLEPFRARQLKGFYDGICEKCDVWSEYKDIFFRWQKR